MNRSIAIVPALFVLTVSVLAAGCDEGSLVSVPTEECVSGLKWEGGVSHTDEMYPGRDCNSCHRSEGEGPIFDVAGTVYADWMAATDCAGTESVEILLTDATGFQVTVESNRAGNFHYRGDLEFPIMAAVRQNGETREMTTPILTGDCNSCHTAQGANAAPGRIVIPGL